MKLKSTLVIVVSLWLMPAPAAAADKTHQQLMAEIRMLQEQQAQLQQMLGGLADTLKTMAREDRRADRRDAQGVRRPDAGRSTASPKACGSCARSPTTPTSGWRR